VSLEDARAYCRWLSETVREIDLGDGRMLELPPGYIARLPSEAEWEKAARGEHGAEYPWGEEFAIERTNTEESDEAEKNSIGTTAVCTYLAGQNPSGIWDLAGNIWEWTGTVYDKEIFILKGGSYYFDNRFARCAARFRYLPGYFDGVAGFRVVLSLANS
jgi:formylglycine-generating enzyme required for sulfatase activity